MDFFFNRPGPGNPKKKTGKEDDNDRCRMSFQYDFTWCEIMMSSKFA